MNQQSGDLFRAGAIFLLVILLLVLPACPSSNNLSASFTANPRSGAVPLSVHFTDVSTAGETAISGWLWDFGDGSTSTEQNPVHVYSAASSYNVSLTVTAGETSNEKTVPAFITVLGNEGDGTVTPEQSQAMIDEVTEQVRVKVASSSLSDVLNTAVAFLEEQNIVSRAGLSNTGAGAWAQLTNGSYYLIMIDPKPTNSAKEQSLVITPPTTSPVITPLLPEPSVLVKGDSYGHLPTKPMIFLNLNVDDSAATARVAEFAGFAAKYGYSDAVGVTVPPGSNLPYGDVEWFKNLADYGVVYINSKGMTLARDSSNPLGITAILTKEARDITHEINDSALWADIQAGRVLPATIFSWADDGNGGYTPVVSERYCVSSSYISYCDQFDDGSLVYLDGGGFYALDMAEAFRFKNTTSFVGWNAVPSAGSANQAARYLFSRAFGEQILNAPTNMPNRPFPFDNAVEGLEARGWNISPSPYDGFTASASPITLDSRGNLGLAYVLFRPTIGLNMFVSADGKHLHIPGDFGDKQGTVTINGMNVNVEEWSVENGIVAGIDYSDWGNVVVEVDGKKSPAIPLCRWHGKFSATGTLPGAPDWGPKIDINCNTNFRADLHPYRGVPDSEPEYSHTGADFEEDAIATYMIHAGEHLDAADKQIFKWYDKVITLDFHPNAPDNFTWGTVDFDYHEGTASFSLSGSFSFMDYDVLDAETGAFLYKAQWVVWPSFMVTANIGVMGTIEGKTVADTSTGLQVTVPQMEADPMTDFDDVQL